MGKRSRLEIIRDILLIVQNNHEIKPTPLLRRSNISSSRFKEYYTDLLDKGFLQKSSGESKQVALTPKGQRFLEKYRTIIGFIEEFDL